MLAHKNRFKKDLRRVQRGRGSCDAFVLSTIRVLIEPRAMRGREGELETADRLIWSGTRAPAFGCQPYPPGYPPDALSFTTGSTSIPPISSSLWGTT